MPRKRPTTPEESHINIIPIGRVEALAVSVVAANLQTLMGLNAATLPSQPEPEYAYLPLRSQYAAGQIIKEIESIDGGARFKLGIVQCDLCTPILKFVFGESQLGGTAAVISVHRLVDKDPARMYLRAAKIGLHETGHLLGIGHCHLFPGAGGDRPQTAISVVCGIQWVCICVDRPFFHREKSTLPRPLRRALSCLRSHL